MTRRLLIGILVVLGIAVIVFNPLISLILAVGGWIYLISRFRKQKSSAFYDEMEQQITALHSKRLKVFLIVAGCSVLVCILGALAHNMLHGVSETEEAVSLIIALVGIFVFVGTTADGWLMFLRGRQKTT
ncbi:MAG: hypothetical protein P8181_01350 [bacterium]